MHGKDSLEFSTHVAKGAWACAVEDHQQDHQRLENHKPVRATRDAPSAEADETRLSFSRNGSKATIAVPSVETDALKALLIPDQQSGDPLMKRLHRGRSINQVKTKWAAKEEPRKKNDNKEKRGKGCFFK